MSMGMSFIQLLLFSLYYIHITHLPKPRRSTRHFLYVHKCITCGNEEADEDRQCDSDGEEKTNPKKNVIKCAVKWNSRWRHRATERHAYTTNDFRLEIWNVDVCRYIYNIHILIDRLFFFSFHFFFLRLFYVAQVGERASEQVLWMSVGWDFCMFHSNHLFSHVDCRNSYSIKIGLMSAIELCCAFVVVFKFIYRSHKPIRTEANQRKNLTKIEWKQTILSMQRWQRTGRKKKQNFNIFLELLFSLNMYDMVWC